MSTTRSQEQQNSLSQSVIATKYLPCKILESLRPIFNYIDEVHKIYETFDTTNTKLINIYSIFNKTNAQNLPIFNKYYFFNSSDINVDNLINNAKYKMELSVNTLAKLDYRYQKSHKFATKQKYAIILRSRI